jgi:hypothetical protein
VKRDRKVRLGKMRSANGPRRLLVIAATEHKCSRSVVAGGERWGDDVQIWNQIYLQDLQSAGH